MVTTNAYNKFNIYFSVALFGSNLCLSQYMQCVICLVSNVIYNIIIYTHLFRFQKNNKLNLVNDYLLFEFSCFFFWFSSCCCLATVSFSFVNAQRFRDCCAVAVLIMDGEAIRRIGTKSTDNKMLFCPDGIMMSNENSNGFKTLI